MKVFLLVSALLLLSTLAVQGTPVYDVSGEPLKPQMAYHITSAIWGAGGGGLYPHWCAIEPPCQPGVVQSPRDVNQGSPVTFSPVINAGSEVVQLLTDLSIQFQIPDHAPGTKPTVWKLADANQQNGRQYVTLDRVAGNVEAYFKIARMSQHTYKLMYCPSVKDSSIDAPCGDLGIHLENGKRLLGLSDRPFEVVFIKAGNRSSRPLHYNV